MVDDRRNAAHLANAGEAEPETESNAPDDAQAKALAEAEAEAKAKVKATATAKKEAKAQAAKVEATDRRGTAAVAAAVFILFAITVFGFHEIARVSANDLGVSRWSDLTPTEGRLKAIVDTVVHTNGLAGWFAKETDTSVLVAADDDEAVKTWEAFTSMAEALSEDEAKARLVARWAAALQNPQSSSLVRESVRGYLKNIRAGADSSEERRAAATAHVQTVVDVYTRALNAVADDWLKSELPQLAIEGLLKENNAVVKKPGPPAPAARSGKTPNRNQTVTKAGGPAPPSSTPAATAATPFVDGLHVAASRFLIRAETVQQIREMSLRDLNLSSAQEPIVKAIGNDFSGRWMWTIAAAIFLTAAISAVLGGGSRVYHLCVEAKWMWPILFYAAAVAGGIAWGYFGIGEMPAFLSKTFDEFNLSYGLAIRRTATLMQGVTAAAIGALIVAAWTSFLFSTFSDDYLEKQLALLRWSFHAATFVLVAGVLHTYALYQWPSSFMGDTGSAVIQSGARVASLALGATFSTLLLLIYVPGASVLKAEARARLLTDDTVRKERIEEMLKRNGFDESPMQQIVRFAQLFAPLLIAPLGAEIVGLFGD